MSDRRGCHGCQRMQFPSDSRPLFSRFDSFNLVLIIITVYNEEHNKTQPMGMYSDCGFCTRSAISSCYDNVSNYVQTPWHFKYRYRSVHGMALSSMGNQTILESVCRFDKNEKMVGIDNAVCYSYLYGGRGDNAAVKLFLRFNIISVLDYGILFSHTRYCG